MNRPEVAAQTKRVFIDIHLGWASLDMAKLMKTKQCKKKTTVNAERDMCSGVRKSNQSKTKINLHHVFSSCLSENTVPFF